MLEGFEWLLAMSNSRIRSCNSALENSHFRANVLQRVTNSNTVSMFFCRNCISSSLYTLKLTCSFNCFSKYSHRLFGSLNSSFYKPEAFNLRSPSLRSPRFIFRHIFTGSVISSSAQYNCMICLNKLNLLNKIGGGGGVDTCVLSTDWQFNRAIRMSAVFMLFYTYMYNVEFVPQAATMLYFLVYN